MNCPMCQHPNADEAVFCKHCGYALAGEEVVYASSLKRHTDLLLILAASLMLFNRFFWFGFPKLVEEWWTLQVVTLPINLITLFGPLVLVILCIRKGQVWTISLATVAFVALLLFFIEALNVLG